MNLLPIFVTILMTKIYEKQNTAIAITKKHINYV